MIKKSVNNIYLLLLVFSRWVLSDSLWPHGLQQARFLCPPLSPGVCSNSWIHAHWVGNDIQPSHPLSPPFSSCLQSFLASGSFPMSQLFASGGQSIEASASASVIPMNIQCWFPECSIQQKLKVTMKYNLYWSLYSFSKYIKSLSNVPGTGLALNIVPERKPRGADVRHEIQVWEISEIWNPGQLNDFLNLAQDSDQFEYRSKTLKDAYSWSKDLKTSIAICRPNIKETHSAHTHLWGWEQGRCTVIFLCPMGFRPVDSPIKMQPKIKNGQKFSQNVS